MNGTSSRDDDSTAVEGDDPAPSPPTASLLAPLKYVGRPLRGLEELADEYGDIVSVPVGSETLCLVTHPDAVRQVLATEAAAFSKGHVQKQYLGTIVGNGILLSEGEHWGEQRAKIQPAFDRDRFQQYAGTVADCASRLTDDWDDGDVVVLDEELERLTLEILAEALFDLELGPLAETFGETGRTISERFDFTSLTTFVPEWVPIPKHRRYRRALDEFDAALYELIAERRRAVEAGADDSGGDVLSLLLPTCDDETLRDELATILLGGHDTSALAITYTLYLIAENPAIEARVREECASALGGASTPDRKPALDGKPTLAAVEELEYTERVVREAMRLYPPAYAVFREPTEPVEVGGYTVEPGTTMVMPQWVVHRDERWWDDPEAVRPERWERPGDRPEYAYFPFSGGPRGCIGRNFAMVEIKVAVATLLADYEFEAVDDGPLSFTPSLTLRPEGGLPMRVRRRE